MFLILGINLDSVLGYPSFLLAATTTTIPAILFKRSRIVQLVDAIDAINQMELVTRVYFHESRKSTENNNIIQEASFY